jgi:hypothetical protein
MASIRLTTAIREQILANVMQGAFPKQHLETKLANDVYAFIRTFYKKERDAFSKLAVKVPKLWDTRANSIQITHLRKKGENARHLLVYGDNICDFSNVPNEETEDYEVIQAARRLAKYEAFRDYLEGHNHEKQMKSSWGVTAGFFGPSLLDLNKETLTAAQLAKVDGFFEQKAAIKLLENQRRDLQQQVCAVLGSVNTMKQLLEAWPEVDEFLPVVPGVSRAITVRIGDVNKLIAAARK